MKVLALGCTALLLTAAFGAQAIELPNQMTPSGEKFAKSCSDQAGQPLTNYRAKTCQRLLNQWHLEAKLSTAGVVDADLSRISQLALQNRLSYLRSAGTDNSVAFSTIAPTRFPTGERLRTNTAAGR